MQRLTIDIWSDIACPWCYIGKRRLEAALGRFAHRDQVDVVWHGFELDPAAPAHVDDALSQAARLAHKYGTSVAQAERMMANVARIGAAEGLDLRLDRVRSTNTFDAHRVLQLARTKGHELQRAAQERLFAAYLTDGEALGERATLIRLAAQAGLAEAEVAETLASGAFADEVRGDERRASELGIHGVPFFVLAWKYGVSGAQPADLLLGAMEQAWSELATPDEAARED